MKTVEFKVTPVNIDAHSVKVSLYIDDRHVACKDLWDFAQWKIPFLSRSHKWNKKLLVKQIDGIKKQMLKCFTPDGTSITEAICELTSEKIKYTAIDYMKDKKSEL